jgi:hypothetical protein
MCKETSQRAQVIAHRRQRRGGTEARMLDVMCMVKGEGEGEGEEGGGGGGVVMVRV